VKKYLPLLLTLLPLTFSGCGGGASITPNLGSTAPIAGSNPSQVSCVRSTATLLPPIAPPPGPPDGSVLELASLQADAIPAPCSGNLVPSALTSQTQYVPKGNPLLGARVGAASSARSTLSTTPACNGMYLFGTCYFYAAAAYAKVEDGAGMVTMVERPYYDDSGGEGHSLDEVSVLDQTTGTNNVVELGWLVDSQMNGDSNPHLFIFHWIKGVGTCYNACGWQQLSSTYYPGMSLKSFVGKTIFIGYEHTNGGWWAWMNGQWMGYFPDSVWSSAYTKAALYQWFGEVASKNGVPPKTAMGDGLLPTNSGAATMTDLCDVSDTTGICVAHDLQTLYPATVPAYYNILRTGPGAVRYGGSGK
jgi:hypothetical protein